MDSKLAPGERSSTTGKTYWLGTDDQGRDMLSGIFYGLRISLGVGVASTVLALAIGLVLGLAAAYFGGWVDAVIMRIVDIQLSFPAILIALVLLAVLGQGVGKIIIALVDGAVGVLRAHRALLGAGRAAEGIRRGRAGAGALAAAHRASATCCPTACRRSSSSPRCRSPTRSRSRRRSRSWAWACRSPSPRSACSSPTASSTCSRASTGSASIPGWRCCHHRRDQPRRRPAARHPQPEAASDERAACSRSRACGCTSSPRRAW